MKLSGASSYAAVLAAVLVLAWSGMKDPLCNWDLVGYTACALEASGVDPGDLQETTYGLLRESVPARDYAGLVFSSSRRIARASDPSSFSQHLPFYRVRPFYILILASLAQAGLDPLASASLTSTLAAIAAMLLLIRLVPGFTSASHRIIVSAGCLGCGLITVARLATPDALAALAFVGSSALLMRRRTALLLLLPASVLVRPDMLLCTLLFHAYILRFRIFGRTGAAASAAASVLLCAAESHLLKGYGWATSFNYAFAEPAVHPAELPTQVDPGTYLEVIRRSLLAIPHSEPWVFGFLALIIAGLLLLRAGSRGTSQSANRPGNPSHPPAGTSSDAGFILTACGLCFALHFLVFPAAWIRFFAGQCATALALTAWLALERVRSNTGGCSRS